MTIIREEFIATPQVKAARSGVLEHATVTERESGFGWRATEDALFESYNCLDTLAKTTICPEPDAEPKDFQNGAWQPGFNFTVYGGVVCNLIGLDRQNQRSEIERVFLANESKGVERGLLGTRFVADPDSAWAAPVDLTPAGGAVDPKVGQALLEEFAGQEYAGLPTLHYPRSVASLLQEDFEVDGTRLFTVLGSKVVNGAGYSPSTGPTGAAAPAGERWAYVTGEVVVEKGALTVSEAIAHANNESYVLVERSYRVAVDCFTAAIRVKVS